MKLLMVTLMIFGLLQPLSYGIRSLTHLSRQRRRMYPLLRIQSQQGVGALITQEGTDSRQVVSPLFTNQKGARYAQSQRPHEMSRDFR